LFKNANRTVDKYSKYQKEQGIKLMKTLTKQSLQFFEVHKYISKLAVSKV